MNEVLEAPAAAPGTNGKQLARREFQPLAPIGTAGGLKSLLESQRNSLAMMLPKHLTPERLAKTLLVAANRNPDILRCTQASVIETVNRAAELGLDLSGTLGEAYPVPFNNKIKTADGREVYAMQLTLIIGYRGLEKLAWQSGEVESIDAEVVREHDHFVFRKGTEVHVEWSPKIGGERGEVLGAYACVKMKSGGKLARFLPRGDIEKIRNKAKSKNSPAWADWWDEMARKCALKRTLKDAPLSTEKFVKAMEQEEADYGLADVLEAQTVPDRGTAGVLKKLTAKPVSESQTFEPADDAAEQVDRQTGEVNSRARTELNASSGQRGVTPAEDSMTDSTSSEPSRSTQPDPDTSGGDAEPPTEDLEEVPQYRFALLTALQAAIPALDAAKSAKAIDGWRRLNSDRPDGDPPLEKRRGLWDAIAAGKVTVSNTGVLRY